MAKEDTTPGLLSKVVKFVRNPATNWSDLDTKAAGQDEAMSKQMLKEMIERKRRNDFVRKREFDMLRKMRKREAMTGQDPGARPSFFQSSMPSKPDDRAVTLKKIDEIEAQMSMQWWKTKHGTGAIPSIDSTAFSSSVQPMAGRLSTHATLLDNALPASYAPTAPSALVPTKAAPAASAATAPVQPRTAAAPPGPAPAPIPVTKAATPGPAPRPAVAAAAAMAGQFGLSREGTASGFSASKFSVVDGAEVAHDPELEEASIRFANGDDAGAESGLLETLTPQGSRAQHADTWLALFDLYRATAQQDKFENLAIEFVGRFDRSAPQWFSMPDMVRQMAAPVSHAANGPAADWVCPSVLGIQTIAALNAALARSTMPWRLDWKNLKTIDANAVEPLCKVFSGWAAQPVQLRFMGEPVLQRILQDATPSGTRETAQGWWQLRMEALRVTHQPDEFELTALDFCVTYEVSPPAWDSARCDYKSMDPPSAEASGQAIVGDVYRDSVPSSMSSATEGDTQMDGHSQMSNLYAVELSGQIEGDAIAVLDQLEAKMMGADIMVISCAKLIRVDFSAAGTLLNWVSAREAENRAVQFTDVNRLVAAFFNVIGITEHASVLSRID
ncbi:MAG: STAS domain-containing protein [Polaromonas sp.]|uniref:STAS domain-containing protein n=1 Tax=Polaromonas sp. TaxID=1869339 RepID=UPI002730B085|nr:STAS domain-containing protein [Polaromonas sp.]MDP1742890.1 STAS domain-containing protein [Polaromonas sp.]MDP1953611.1 STAS domain-containing protein [Polaromonas sp.]MDP3755840.1 STAS domain-containing protein [Polaromonas sp.]